MHQNLYKWNQSNTKLKPIIPPGLFAIASKMSISCCGVWSQISIRRIGPSPLAYCKSTGTPYNPQVSKSMNIGFSIFYAFLQTT